MRSGNSLADIVLAFPEEIARIQALPPHLKETERASWGAFFFGMSAYGWLTVGLYLPGPWKLGLAALAAFGLLLLVVGLRGSRGRPRSVMGIFWNLAALVSGWWVVAHWLPGLWANFLGRGLCIGMICFYATRLFIALRGEGGDARIVVDENIAANEFDWDG